MKTRFGLAFARASACALVAGVHVAGLPAQSKRPITSSDLYAFKWVADPQISPDAKQVIYVLVEVNAKHDGYTTSIWAVPADGSAPPRRLTRGEHDTAPRWSPDSRSIAFLRSDGKQPAQLHLLSLSLGEAMPITALPKGASAAVWSPDGAQIAFTSTTLESDFKDSSRAGSDTTRADGHGLAAAADTARESKSDVHVITRAVYQFNGQGILDPTRYRHIWTVSVGSALPKPQPTELTTGDYDAGDIAWSADGTKLYFTADTVREPYYVAPDVDLFAVGARGGAVETVADIDGPIGDAASSPDGRSFAFSGFVNPKAARSYDEPHLFVTQSGHARDVAPSYDFDVGGDVSSDQHPPRAGGGSPIVWSADGSSLVTVTAEHGTSNLMRFTAAGGAPRPVTTGDHDIVSYSATPDGQHFAVTVSDPTHIGDIFAMNAASGSLTQLTHVNDSLMGTLALSTPEPFWYRSFDGRRVQGWVMKPPGFDPSKKYPMILQIHGGPHTAYGFGFFHEFQLMAAKGYVVLYTNPRGSTSYGQEFANVIQYRYPGDDYKDLMVAVDTLVRRGYVDPKRLGVTGGSGGGLLTNWIVTQTNRFAAAVSLRSVGDWIGFWYTADFTLFRPTWFRTMPFDDPEEFEQRSPTRYARRVTTPLMLIGGEQDLRTPIGQGDAAMFRALKAQHKPTVLILFPRETHELSRSGEPRHRVERLDHIMEWFDKYLLGAPIHTYDVR